ncbi:hypothetical protein M422DRAFT_272814 [Sphaerobolus stellatus SS14]|uniref:Unplaced genomic scaffold SPHSTscaffold_306, whole genome shotgun sequence n=1 Tax=Sphaerobolus stellatus (strain SS14) TaxID=990650 RepID=A0A0C9ULM5_SPHS4|nr:hypothetical protein M422DRAFT_272814 [Sphaerobolus stellatus SS14]
MSIRRAYAVSGGKRVIAIPLGVLLALHPATIIALAVTGINASKTSLTAVAALLSDAAVMIITGYFAFRESRRIHELLGNRATLTTIFVRQGVIRFIIIFIWNLEGSINEKLLNPFIAGVDSGLENAVSCILICRFMLELRKFNEHVQTVPSIHIATQPGIRRHLSRFNEEILDEFGNTGMPYEWETETEGYEDEEASPPENGLNTKLGITVEEFPWTVNGEANLSTTSTSHRRKARHGNNPKD